MFIYPNIKCFHLIKILELGLFLSVSSSMPLDSGKVKINISTLKQEFETINNQLPRP
jgi:hypothetical protein